MSILESIARQRALLDYPMSNRPSLHVQYWETTDAFQEMYNRLANSNESFAQDEKTLNIVPNVDVYTVSSDPAFGKVILVTTQSNDANHIERSIDFSKIQDLKFGNWQPDNYKGNWFEAYSGNHSAEKMAFYYDNNGVLKVRVTPKPQEAATYKIRFSVGDWASNATFDNSPILRQFHRLFEVRAALAVLPYCEWDGVEKEERLQKIGEIKESLMNKERRYEADFLQHIKTITKPKIILRRACFD